MGSALARALLAHGHDVTIWNRTPDKAASLVAAGATLAASPQEAVAASPLAIMCVFDYAAADQILQAPSVAGELSGKTLVQLSTGLIDQVREQQDWVGRHDAKFIAGGIVAYPHAIGQVNCMILYAGDAVFQEHRSTLVSLGGASQYLGTDVGAAVGAYFAMSAYMIGALGLFFETAAFNRHYGLPIDTHYSLVRIVTDEVLAGIRDGAHRMATDNLDGKSASIDLTVAGMTDVCETFSQTGIPSKMTDALVDMLRIASKAGAGDKDISALVDVLYRLRKT